MPRVDVKKVQPLNDNVFIERLGAWPGMERDSGLIVVEDKPRMEVGRVKSVGPGYSYYGFDQSPERSPMDVSEGDLVMFDRYAGADIDDDHVMLHHGEILGVYTGKLPEREQG